MSQGREEFGQRDSAIINPATNVQTPASHISNPALPRLEVSGSTEEYTIILPTHLRPRRKILPLDEDEPLVDTTAAIPLNSKKTKRREERLTKKKQKQSVRSHSRTALLDLPAELLLEVLSHLQPSDVLTLLRLNHATHDFIRDHESAITHDLTRSRYWVLQRSFPLPVFAVTMDTCTQAALRHSKRQELLAIHKKPYQHIPTVDAANVCTCTACLFAWNNLCIALDLAHFQSTLDSQQPIPMIARGSTPAWNVELLSATAAIVERAMASPLTYAAILQTHLHTITGTLLRHSKPRAPAQRNAARTLTSPKTLSSPPAAYTRRLYQLSAREAAKGTDEFLERQGPPSYEPPFHRDNYYGIQAYVPNRKWSKEERRWRYFGSQHARDVALARTWFMPRPEETREDLLRAFRASVEEVEGMGTGMVKR